MKNGYDQFFKKARAVANSDSPTSTFPQAAVAKPSKRPTKSNHLVAQELRQRLLEKKKRKKKAGISWKMASLSFLGLVLAAFGYFEHQKVEKFLKGLEISFIGRAEAEADAKPKEEKAEGKESADKAAAEKKSEEKSESQAKKDFTPEEINHFAKLNEKKRELDAREEELNRLEAEIQAQKVELEKRIQSLEKTRREISSVLEDKVQTDEKKLATLVETYSTMRAQQAAKVFEDMDEDLAVEIIGRMKKKNAAEILNLMKPAKAKAFTEKFAGYKRNN